MKYEDMLYLPHPEPRHHVRMSRSNRAAQFAPFAALTGYEELVQEAGRTTEREVILEEEVLLRINEQLTELEKHIAHRPFITITFFERDEKKEGGAYRTLTQRLCKMNRYEKKLTLESGIQIQMESIQSIESDLFGEQML